MPTAGTLSELASFPDSRLRIIKVENGLLIMMESLDRVLAHYDKLDAFVTQEFFTLQEAEDFVAKQLFGGVGIDIGNGNPLSVGKPHPT